MTSKIKTICQKSEDLVQKKQYAEAEHLLLEGLKKYPDDPDLHAHYVRRLLATQREPDAISHLEQAKGSKLFEQVGQHLVDFFYCRSLMAKKLSIPDEPGKKGFSQVRKITGLQPGNVGVTLSACLITKNEEKTLERCLKSIKSLVDEIVVVDTGSTDHTVEVAKKFGAKIGFFEWDDDFSAARNETLKLATGHWVLWIDADESLTKASISRIQEGLMRPFFGGYHIKIINYMSDQDEASQYVHTPLRIFQRLEGVYFEGKIHEQVLHRLEALGYTTAVLQNASLNHYGYAPSVMKEKNKIERTIGLLEKALDEDPKDSFQWFNLANAYMIAGRVEECEQAARKSVEFIKPNVNYGPIVYNLLATSLSDQNKPQEALHYCDEAEQQGYGGILNEFERAHALLRLEQLEEALQTIHHCMTLSWPDDYDGDYSITTYKSKVLKGQILAKMQRYEEALAVFDEALKVAPHFAVCLYSKGAALACIGRDQEALEYFEKCFNDPQHAQRALNLAIHLYFQHENYQAAAEAIEKLWFLGNYSEELFSKWTLCADRLKSSAILGKIEAVFEKIGNPGQTILINYGRALLSVGNHELALECFQKSLIQNPNESNAYFNAGDVLYLMERFDEAAEHYEAGLRLSPESPNAWATLGNSMYQMGIHQGAKICYEQALFFDPQNLLAKNNLRLLEPEEESQEAA